MHDGCAFCCVLICTDRSSDSGLAFLLRWFGSTVTNLSAFMKRFCNYRVVQYFTVLLVWSWYIFGFFGFFIVLNFE